MFARIGTRDVPVVKASVDWKQNEASTFTVTVPAADFADRADLLYEDIAIYRRDVKVVSGIVWDKPLLEVGEPRSTLNYNVRCTDEIGRLSLVRADFFSNAHYQDVLVLDILLALMPTGWALGGTSTMFDTSLKTTVDLRGKETRLAQILAIVKTIPKLWIRYGGIGTGNHLLDVGYFGEKTAYAVQGDNLQSLRLQANTTPQIKAVEAYADAGAGGTIRLQNALGYMIAFGYSSDITSDPNWSQFPIVEDPAASGHFVVQNTALTKGGELVKSFNIHRPRMDTMPTIQEVTEAAYGIYQDAVRFLQKSNDYKSYQLKAHFKDIPKVNDKIYVNAAAREFIYDGDQGAFLERETYQVEETFHVVGVATELEEVMQRGEENREDEPAFVCTVDVTDNDYAEEVEQEDDYQEHIEQAGLPASNTPIGDLITTPSPDSADNTDAGRCALANYITDYLRSIAEEALMFRFSNSASESILSLHVYLATRFRDDLEPSAVYGLATEFYNVGYWNIQYDDSYNDEWGDIKCELLTILTTEATVNLTATIINDWATAVAALSTQLTATIAVLINSFSLASYRSHALYAVKSTGWCDDCSGDSPLVCGELDFRYSRWGWYSRPDITVDKYGKWVAGKGFKAEPKFPAPGADATLNDAGSVMITTGVIPTVTFPSSSVISFNIQADFGHALYSPAGNAYTVWLLYGTIAYRTTGGVWTVMGSARQSIVGPELSHYGQQVAEPRTFGSDTDITGLYCLIEWMRIQSPPEIFITKFNSGLSC